MNHSKFIPCFPGSSIFMVEVFIVSYGVTTVNGMYFLTNGLQQLLGIIYFRPCEKSPGRTRASATCRCYRYLVPNTCGFLGFWEIRCNSTTSMVLSFPWSFFESSPSRVETLSQCEQYPHSYRHWLPCLVLCQDGFVDIERLWDLRTLCGTTGSAIGPFPWLARKVKSTELPSRVMLPRKPLHIQTADRKSVSLSYRFRSGTSQQTDPV